MPRAKSKVESGWRFDASMASSSCCTDFSAKPSRASRRIAFTFLRSYRSATFSISFASSRAFTRSGPSPRMSIAPLLLAGRVPPFGLAAGARRGRFIGPAPALALLDPRSEPLGNHFARAGALHDFVFFFVLFFDKCEVVGRESVDLMFELLLFV